MHLKQKITIEYNSGESQSVITNAADWTKLEKEVGKSITEIGKNIAVWDVLFLAYQAIKRNTAPKPIKVFEQWLDTVADFNFEQDTTDPKATNAVV